jgi:hypothetical protein
MLRCQENKMVFSSGREVEEAVADPTVDGDPPLTLEADPAIGGGRALTCGRRRSQGQPRELLVAVANALALEADPAMGQPWEVVGLEAAAAQPHTVGGGRGNHGRWWRLPVCSRI